MQPTLARASFHRPGWVFETKYDGWRMIPVKDGVAGVRLISRQGVDHTVRFAELASAVAQLPARRLVLDGEVCVFDAELVSQFHLLGEGTPDELATPPVFIAFDMLQIGARDLRARPLRDRRPALEAAIAGSRFVLPALRLERDGFDAWDQVKRGGWEGLVAKDEASRYVGGVTRSWLKVKIRLEARFLVVGLDVPLAGACSLLLAARRGRRLIYVGRSSGAPRARSSRGSATGARCCRRRYARAWKAVAASCGFTLTSWPKYLQRVDAGAPAGSRSSRYPCS
jgi:bifunctional non-homologous end joining protein LigD